MRLFLTITEEKRRNVIAEFYQKSINVEWETDNVITIDENDGSKVSKILLKNQIPFIDIEVEVPFGNIIIKGKVDKVYLLAQEIMDELDDLSEYTDEENDLLDELANVINAYKLIFDTNTGTVKTNKR